MLANVPDDAAVMQEEPFGPLAIVNPVDSLDTAIDRANSVPYGLAAYGFTNRADYADRMVEKVEAGNLSINTLEASLPETPFGGVKSSGYGREGGSEGLHHYTDRQERIPQPAPSSDGHPSNEPSNGLSNGPSELRIRSRSPCTTAEPTPRPTPAST